MAKGIIHLDGLDNVIGDFERIADSIDVQAKKSLTNSMSSIANGVKSNVTSMFNKGYSKGRMLASSGYHVGENYDGIITSSVGVYYDGVSDPKRRVTAPILASMYEAGIQPHSTASGARLAHKSGAKEKNQVTGKKGILHGGSPIIPFISSAFDAGSPRIFTDMIEELNNSIDK